MIPQTYPSTYESFNGSTSMVVYELSSVVGLKEWIDYIPIKDTVPSQSEVNTYANNGAIAIESLTSNTGLQGWLNYIPVYTKSTGTAWVDYIPVFRQATFISALTSTVSQRTGTGSATFTRATTATVEDNEGVVRPVLSGEVRFQGARRVRNLLTTTSTLSTQNVTTVAGTYTLSFYGTGSIALTGTVTDSLAGTGASIRVQKTVTATAGTLTLTVTGSVTDAQLENVTGQSVQTAGEYVSVGVLSSPYHGAMVDGVKYFDTTLAGAPISTATLKGYLAEGARTNLLKYSEQFDDTYWSLLNATVTANAAVAPSGATSADKLVETAATGDHRILNALGETVTSGAAYTWSVFAKAGERTSVRVVNNNLAGATFDLNTGAASNVSGGITASSLNFGNGWYRLYISGNAATTTERIVVYLVSGGNTNYTGDGTSGLFIWGAQLEAGAFASTYIPTTTASVTRNADVLTYPVSGNVIGTVGSAYAEINFPSSIASTTSVVVSGANNLLLISNANAVLIGDGTTNTSRTFTPSNSTQKIASAWGGSSKIVTVGGISPGSGSFDGDLNFGVSFGIGCTGGGTFQMFSPIRNVRIYQTQLSSTQLQAITT